ncbi:hypothetical protein ACLOJK_032738 [Asimina triloba]
MRRRGREKQREWGREDGERECNATERERETEGVGEGRWRERGKCDGEGEGNRGSGLAGRSRERGKCDGEGEGNRGSGGGKVAREREMRERERETEGVGWLEGREREGNAGEGEGNRGSGGGKVAREREDGRESSGGRTSGDRSGGKERENEIGGLPELGWASLLEIAVARQRSWERRRRRRVAGRERGCSGECVRSSGRERRCEREMREPPAMALFSRDGSCCQSRSSLPLSAYRFPHLKLAALHEKCQRLRYLELASNGRKLESHIA